VVSYSETISPELSVAQKGRVTIVTFEAPALRRTFLMELEKVLAKLEADPGVCGIVFTGRRSVFMTGAQLDEIVELNDGTSAVEFLALPHSLVTKFRRSRKILMAAINGYCLGGGLELALACDLRFAVDEVMGAEGKPVPYIGFPEAQLGLIPAVGGVYLAVELIGLSHARSLFFDAQPITSQEARSIGLVDYTAPASQLMELVQEHSDRMFANSIGALASIKSLLNSSAHGLSLEQGLHSTAAAFAECCTRGDKNTRIAQVRLGRRRAFKSCTS
jgi:enoyl-CoA hydratase/carnithine racemase